jgi:hypothetical protein
MFKHGKILGIFLLVFLSSEAIFSSEQFNVYLVCSSFLNNDPRYSICNIFDNDIRTCWAEGVPTSGNGTMRDKIYVHCDTWSIIPDENAAEMVICYMPFPPRSMAITKIRIYNGYGKNEALWKANNRVKKLGMIIDGYQGIIVNNDYTNHYTYTLKINLQDKGWNDIVLSDYIKDSDNIDYVSRIRFYILDTYRGSKYNDTCISEIEFYNQDEKYKVDQVREIKTRYGIPDDEEG